MQKQVIGRYLGFAATCMGAWWIVEVVRPFFKDSPSGPPPELLFILFIVPMMSVPGAFAVYFGLRVYRLVSEASLKGLIGTGAFFLGLGLYTFLKRNPPVRLSEEIDGDVYMLLSSALVWALYLWSTPRILSLFTFRKCRIVELIGPKTLLLFAYLIHSLLRAAFEEYSPAEEGYEYVKEAPWGLLGLLVPITVAVGFYKIARWWLDRVRKAAVETAPALSTI